MNKIEKDGKIAVLISRGYGLGWSTGYPKYKEFLCMDADIVQAIMDNNPSKAARIARRKCPNAYISISDTEKLMITWVDKDASFEIDEYSGNESIHVIGNREYMKA